MNFHQVSDTTQAISARLLVKLATKLTRRVISLKMTAKSNTPVLPDEDALHLKCSLCSCYLSIGPIKTSIDGTKYQCGRCDFNDPDITVRNFSYEKIAKFMAFPCIYENCQSKILWCQVQQHELNCPYRTICCPVPDCNTNVLCGRVIEHFNQHHRFAVISNVAAMFYKLNTSLSSFIGMLIHEETPFFCLICNDGKKFKVSVYSVNSVKYQRYQIDVYTLTFYRKKISMQGDKIVPYNDREHCVNCYLRTCRSKLHKYAVNHGNIFEMTTEVDVQSIRTILKSDTICCKISIESENNLNNIENVDIIRKVTECPICKEYMCGPIYCCNTGHSVCQKCKIKLTKCAVCEAPFTNSRNYALEELSENIIIPCQNANCEFIGTLQDLHLHENSCTIPKISTPTPKTVVNVPASII